MEGVLELFLYCPSNLLPAYSCCMAEGSMGASSSKTCSGLLVTLDALGTLYRFRQPIATQYLQVAKRCGLKAKVDPDSLNQAFKVSFKSLNAELPNYGKGKLSNPQAWWERLVNDAFRQVVKESEIPPHLGDQLYKHFSSSLAYELYPDVKPFFNTMHQLKTRWNKPHDPALIVGVISNSDPRVAEILESLGLRIGCAKSHEIQDAMELLSPSADTVKKRDVMNEINFLQTSYDTRFEKPDPSMFKEAYANYVLFCLQDSALSRGKPSAVFSHVFKFGQDRQKKAIHIGDDLDNDYHGATNAGWGALYLDRDSKGYGTNKEGVDTVSSLTEAALAIQIILEQNFTKAKS